MRKSRSLMALLLGGLLLLTGCSAASRGTKEEDKAVLPPMPDKVTTFEDGVPVLNVYVVDTDETVEMTIEAYLCGVLAGEMKSDWPMEALKAQAILARTFVLKFMTEKESKYGGADVSTDIEEAQAYNAEAVDDNIRRAVEETQGMVLSSGGELPYAWFHAHSGGKTEYAKEGLNWKAEEPRYTRVGNGHENDMADAEAAEWSASFDQMTVLAAAKEAGSTIEKMDSAKVGESSSSGRAVTLIIGGQKVNAPDFRIAIGSTEMRSTLLTDIRVEDGKLIMSGKGFGHGVGMSQWGAYALAKQGKKAEEIAMEYFRNVEVVKMY